MNINIIIFKFIGISNFVPVNPFPTYIEGMPQTVYLYSTYRTVPSLSTICFILSVIFLT